ncbi:hypothetical protein FSARC_7721 [Fusarium sarcochroum]|uniref:ATP synthase subunit delta, mitochondrial n=1 Tax=Fusarium sarcochroum TaxID=1208366 RepID=A0A8H4X7Z5_9HYPO|nr:hypothetical protein FSARC_7721 [Fusarium sarcochroum]
MNSLRFARAALRARPAAIRVPLQRRTYAEAVPDKARRTLFGYCFYVPTRLTVIADQAEPCSPSPANCRTQSIYKSQDVVQVNIPAESGEMGVLANHVPSIEQLKPGLVEVVEESSGSKQFFLSGGFATVQPNSVLSINAVEGYPLEDFSAEAIRAQIAEAQKVANGSGSEQDIAEAKIELEGPRAASSVKSRAPVLSQKEHQLSSAGRSSKGQNTSSRPSVSGLQFRTSHGRPTPSRPSQALRRPATTERPPSESLQSQLMTSYVVSTNNSRTASSTEKCQDAMDILEQYGISRPEGWFSDDNLGTTNQIVQKKLTFSQICHSCGNPLGSERYCSHCGHDSCLKCTGEIPGQDLGHKVLDASVQSQNHSYTEDLSKPPRQAPPAGSHTARVAIDTTRRREMSRFASESEMARTPRWVRTQTRPKPARKKTIAAPTEIASSVKNNPFFMADRGLEKEAPEPAITTRSVQVEQKTKFSDCVPNRLMSDPPRYSHIQEECSDPSCRATHVGHHPARHSVGCATRRDLGAKVVEGNELDKIGTEKDKDEEKHPQSSRESPSRSKLQMKIDQLYHHGQDLHHSQHIMEHLSAGVKTLEPSATTEEKQVDEQDDNSRTDGYNCRVHSQPVTDHSLSRDETATVGEDTTRHSLSTDAVVPDAIESQPHNLPDDPKGDRHPSPKSHEPLDDARNKDARLTKSRLASHDQGYDVQDDHIIPIPSSPPNTKPVFETKALKKGLDVSKEANSRTTLQTQNTTLSHKHDANLDAKKSVGKLDEPVPGAHLLRKTTPRIKDSERLTAEATDISRDLSRNRRTPLSEREKDSCLNCFPSHTSSPKQEDNAYQIFAEDSSKKKAEDEHSTAIESPLPRLKVTDVEQSLAQKSAEELIAKTPQPQDTTVEEPTSSRLLSTTDDPLHEETIIHDPRPVMPYNHMCA